MDPEGDPIEKLGPVDAVDAGVKLLGVLSILRAETWLCCRFWVGDCDVGGDVIVKVFDIASIFVDEPKSGCMGAALELGTALAFCNSSRIL